MTKGKKRATRRSKRIQDLLEKDDEFVVLDGEKPSTSGYQPPPADSNISYSPPPSQLLEIDTLISTPDQRDIEMLNTVITPTSPHTFNASTELIGMRQDIARCEHAFKEKNQYISSVFTKMDKSLEKITDEIDNLLNRVFTLEEKEESFKNMYDQFLKIDGDRIHALEQEQYKNQRLVNIALKKCHDNDDLRHRVNKLEKQIANLSTVCPLQSKHQQDPNTEATCIAIYGLKSDRDLQTTVDELFYTMDVHISPPLSMHRTPDRANKPGVVIVELSSLEDKLNILRRKRVLKSHHVFSSVFVKSAKTHIEQIMDANNKIILKEIANGYKYYINDNGRILQKTLRDDNMSRYDETDLHINRDSHKRNYRDILSRNQPPLNNITPIRITQPETSRTQYSNSHQRGQGQRDQHHIMTEPEYLRLRYNNHHQPRQGPRDAHLNKTGQNSGQHYNREGENHRGRDDRRKQHTPVYQQQYSNSYSNNNSQRKN